MKKIMLVLLLALFALAGCGVDHGPGKYYDDRERRITISRETIDGHVYIIYWNSVDFAPGVGGIVHSASCPHPAHVDTVSAWRSETAR